MDINTIADLSPGEIAQQENEIEQTVNEIIQTANDAEICVKDAEVIADVTEVVEKAGENISPSAVRMTEVVMESIYARLNLTMKKDMVSLETFGGKMSKRDASRIAVEDFKKTVTRVFEALKRVISQIWLGVKTAVIRYFGMTAQMEKQVRLMKEKLVDLSKDAKPRVETFEDATIGKAFSNSEGVVDSQAALAVVKAHTDIVKNFDRLSIEMERASEALNHMAGHIVANTENETAENLAKFNNGFTDVMRCLMKVVCRNEVNSETARKMSTGFMNNKLFVSEPLVNDKIYAVSTYKVDMKIFGKDVDPDGVGIGWKFESHISYERKVSKTVHVLERVDAKRILDLAEKLLNEITGLKAKETFVTKLDKLFAESLKKLEISFSSLSYTQGPGKDLNFIKSSITSYNNSFGKIVLEIPRDALMCVSRALQYVNLSLNNYSTV